MLKKRFVALVVVFLLVFSILVTAKFSAPPASKSGTQATPSGSNPPPAGMVEVSSGKYVKATEMVKFIGTTPRTPAKVSTACAGDPNNCKAEDIAKLIRSDTDFFSHYYDPNTHTFIPKKGGKSKSVTFSKNGQHSTLKLPAGVSPSNVQGVGNNGAIFIKPTGNQPAKVIVNGVIVDVGTYKRIEGLIESKQVTPGQITLKYKGKVISTLEKGFTKVVVTITTSSGSTDVGSSFTVYKTPDGKTYSTRDGWKFTGGKLQKGETTITVEKVGDNPPEITISEGGKTTTKIKTNPKVGTITTEKYEDGEVVSTEVKFSDGHSTFQEKGKVKQIRDSKGKTIAYCHKECTNAKIAGALGGGVKTSTPPTVDPAKLKIAKTRVTEAKAKVKAAEKVKKNFETALGKVEKSKQSYPGEIYAAFAKANPEFVKEYGTTSYGKLTLKQRQDLWKKLGGEGEYGSEKSAEKNNALAALIKKKVGTDGDLAQVKQELATAEAALKVAQKLKPGTGPTEKTDLIFADRDSACVGTKAHCDDKNNWRTESEIDDKMESACEKSLTSTDCISLKQQLKSIEEQEGLKSGWDYASAILGLRGGWEGISSKLFSDEVNEAWAEAANAFANTMKGSVQVPKAICRYHIDGTTLTQSDGEAAHFIEVAPGSVQFVGSIKAEKVIKHSPATCDEETECQLGECELGICKLDDEPVLTNFYKLTWSVKAPSDEKHISPDVAEGYDSIKYNIQLEGKTHDGQDKSTWLYPANNEGSSQTLVLPSGERDSDIFMTYSVRDYDRACIKFGVPPMDLDGDKVNEICTSVAITTPGTIPWDGESDSSSSSSDGDDKAVKVSDVGSKQI